MTRVTLALSLALAVTGALAAEKKSECKAEASKVAKLTKQVEELQAKLAATEAEAERLKGADAGVQLSVLDAVSSAGSLVGSAFQQALDSTDLDETAARHLETVRAASVDAMGKVQAIDLSTHINQVTSHDLYKTHVAPALDAAAKSYDQHVKPAVEQHVNPALEKAKAAATQTMDTALPALNQHKDTVSSGISQVPAFLGSLEAKFGDLLLSPVFELLAKLSPGFGKMVPARPLDRVLLLLVLLVFTYRFVCIATRVVGILLRMSKTITSTSIRVAVVWPLRIALKLLNLMTCFMTCFYCCGLCRRKNADQDSGKQQKKGAEKKEQKKVDGKKKATVEDVVQLLEISKKAGKLDATVQQLLKFEKDQNPMEGKKLPEHVRGKTVDKPTLKKAFGNYKEIDMKMLDKA